MHVVYPHGGAANSLENLPDGGAYRQEGSSGWPSGGARGLIRLGVCIARCLAYSVLMAQQLISPGRP
jgi:hypothetical protein